MARNCKQCDNCVRRPGFTVIECLIGLAISAVLLAAVAVAFNASVINYCENEDMYWTMNNARQALTRMTSQIRVAGYYDDSMDEWYGVSATDPNNCCTLWTPDHELIRYEFRKVVSSDLVGKLYLIKVATSEEYVLCDNVLAATFIKTTDNGQDAKSVQISLTVQSPDGDYQRTLHAAAVLRRIPESI